MCMFSQSMVEMLINDFFFLKNQQKLIIGTKVKFYLKYND